MGPLAELRYRLGRRRAGRRMSRLLRDAAERATAPKDVFKAASSIPVEGFDIRPIQVPMEIEALLDLVRAEGPRRVLEIGTANAGTLYLLAWASAKDARLLSLDIRRFDPVHRRLVESFANGRHVTLMRGDSHLDETRDSVTRFFRGEPIDLLFIDGDHSEKSVRSDYALYAPLVRPGGLIAFHDIVDGPPELVGGVPAFWREVRSTFADPVEIVESWTQGGYGIGVGRVR